MYQVYIVRKPHVTHGTYTSGKLFIVYLKFKLNWVS